MDVNLPSNILWIESSNTISSKALVPNKYLGFTNIMYSQMLTGFIQIILHPFLITGCFSQTTMSPCNMSLKTDLHWFLCEGFKKNNTLYCQHWKFTYTFTFQDKWEQELEWNQVSQCVACTSFALLSPNVKLLPMFGPTVQLWAWRTK